ncbi:MAG: GNAT family N-acetyltransferase [Rhizomicrobium sp.]|jgi:predicted GNAT family acetyltransferase
MSNAVTDNAALSRYELKTDGGIAFVRYRSSAGVRTFIHAEVPSVLRSNGVGSELARGALELAQSQGYKIAPQCPFIAAYIRKHSEFQDLVAG